MSRIWQTRLEAVLAQDTTDQLTATLRDETEQAIPGGSLTTLTLTLYEQITGTIINSRDAQNILGANGGSVDANGLLTLELSPDDNVIVRAGIVDEEWHVALLRWTWGGGKKGAAEVLFRVADLVKVADV